MATLTTDAVEHRATTESIEQGRVGYEIHNIKITRIIIMSLKDQVSEVSGAFLRVSAASGAVVSKINGSKSRVFERIVFWRKGVVGDALRVHVVLRYGVLLDLIRGEHGEVHLTNGSCWNYSISYCTHSCKWFDHGNG